MSKEQSWKGFSALVLENDLIRLVVVPELGGKIASLVDKLHQREWLIQPYPDKPVGPDKSGSFVASNPSGWDEMFPTIDACQYPAPGEFSDIDLPDHGEVWSLPWQTVSMSDTHLDLAVKGKLLPYLLERNIRLESENTLRFDYTLTNQGSSPLYYLWAAHPLFEVNPRTSLVLPSHIDRLYNVLDIEPWSPVGSMHSFPHTTTTDGRSWDLSRVIATAALEFRKFYVPPDVLVNTVGLKCEESQSQLTMSWDETQLPYLGFWLDEGTFANKPTLAPEPSTAFYDKLDRAYDNKRLALLPASATVQWHLRLSFSSV